MDWLKLAIQAVIAAAPEMVKLFRGTHEDLRAGVAPTWRARQDAVDAELARREAAERAKAVP